MTSRNRQDRILAAVRDLGVATVHDLAERLDVSPSTIRRDLRTLDRNGELTRTYGGAVLTRANERPEIPFAVHAGRQVAAKEAIAAKALELVEDESVVLLDIGTTTPLIARGLRGRPVTVITSNVAVLDELRDDDTVRLIMLGGVLRRNYQTLVGSLAESALRQVSADLVFLSCTGVRASGHVVDDMEVEAPIKRAMIEAADRVVLLASEWKFPGRGSQRLCSLADVDVLITTGGTSSEAIQPCLDAGGKAIVA